MSDQNALYEQVMREVTKRLNTPDTPVSAAPKRVMPSTPEFVGICPLGDTIGLAIANVDYELKKALRIPLEYSAIGILGARTGAGPQIMAIDEATKATNSQVISVELPRDTKGGAGHGSLILIAAQDIADARRGIEVALADLPRTFGDVYGNDAGHLEFQYTARASYACHKAFGAPMDKAFGIIVGAPAAIGVLISDVALKAATVNIVACATPNHGQSFSNEVTLLISGDSGAVRQAIIAAREAGLPLLEALGGSAPSSTEPYI